MTYKQSAFIGKGLGRAAGRMAGKGFKDIFAEAGPRNIGSAPSPVMNAIGGRFGHAAAAPSAPQMPLNLSKFRGQTGVNPQPFGMKMASTMNQSQTLGLAFALRDRMQKEAATAAVERGLGSLKGLVGGAMSKAQPMLNKGFNAIGAQASRLPEDGMLSKLLIGANRPVGPAAAMGDGTVGNTFSGLGKQVSKRVGAGAGIAAGGTLAAEAPFKAEHNAEVEQQQQHPIRTWLAQHVMGRQPLKHESYLNPLAI